MRYSLWHTQSGNLVGDFETEDAALSAAAEAARYSGSGYEDLMLERDSDAGTPELLAAGTALSLRAAGAQRMIQASRHRTIARDVQTQATRMAAKSSTVRKRRAIGR